MTEVLLTWDGPEAGRVNGPSIAEILRRIEDLNGEDRTLVTIERASGYLAVGGAASQGMIVYIETKDEIWQALSPLRESTDSIIVVAGGQPGDYPARSVVPIGVAVPAAIAFARSGERAPEVRWELDG